MFSCRTDFAFEVDSSLKLEFGVLASTIDFSFEFILSTHFYMNEFFLNQIFLNQFTSNSLLVRINSFKIKFCRVITKYIHYPYFSLHVLKLQFISAGLTLNIPGDLAISL